MMFTLLTMKLKKQIVVLNHLKTDGKAFVKTHTKKTLSKFHHINIFFVNCLFEYIASVHTSMEKILREHKTSFKVHGCVDRFYFVQKCSFVNFLHQPMVKIHLYTYRYYYVLIVSFKNYSNFFLN